MSYTKHVCGAFQGLFTLPNFSPIFPLSNFYRRKIIFSQACLLSKGWGGVGFPSYITGHMTRRICLQGICLVGKGDSASRSKVCIQGDWAETPPSQRTVGILLECILVVHYYSILENRISVQVALSPILHWITDQNY